MSTLVAAPSWYAVQTKPRCEEQVIHWLRLRTGVGVFLPRLETLRRRARRAVRRVEPLFPSYLFVQMTPAAEQWNAVRWTPGVRRIVGSGDTPVPVPDDAMALIRERCAGDDVIPWEPRLRPGAHVRITSGPFAGLVGVFERPTSRAERVCVLLHLLRTAARVEVSIVDLEELTA